MNITRDRPIRDFAKSSLLELVARKLEETCPELVPAEARSLDTIRQAHISPTLKSDILGLLWRNAGPMAVLSIGQGIQSIDYDPMWQAASRSISPVILLDKWRRFEVFAHSQHRLKIDQTRTNMTSFSRYTVDGGTPKAPENLMICGLVIALLEHIGCQGLRCDMPLIAPGTDDRTFCIRSENRFFVPVEPGTLQTDRWTISWQDFTPRPENTAPRSDLPPLPLAQLPDPTAKELVTSIARILAIDVARQWKISELARETGHSSRTLQRKLSDAGLSFSHLVRHIRIAEACHLLKDNLAPVTTVGFCAGFSDSAHFSRDFRASTGMTPSDYRAINRPA